MVRELEHLNQRGSTTRTQLPGTSLRNDTWATSGGFRPRLDTTVQSAIEGSTLKRIEVRKVHFGFLSRVLGSAGGNDSRREESLTLKGQMLQRTELGASTHLGPYGIQRVTTFERLDAAEVDKLAAIEANAVTDAIAQQSVPAFESALFSAWHNQTRFNDAVDQAVEHIKHSPPEVVELLLEKSRQRHSDLAGVLQRMLEGGVDPAVLRPFVNDVVADEARAQLQQKLAVQPPPHAPDISRVPRLNLLSQLDESSEVPLTVQRDLLLSALRSPLGLSRKRS